MTQGAAAAQRVDADREAADIVDQVAQEVLEDDEQPAEVVEPPRRAPRRAPTPQKVEGPSGPANTPDELERVAREQGLRVNAPMRPELQPGESVTTVPDRFCPKCEQARATRKCPRCNTICVKRVEPEEAEEYEASSLLRETDPRSSFFAGNDEEQEPPEYDDDDDWDDEPEAEEQSSFFDSRQQQQPQRRMAAPPQPQQRRQRTPPARGRNHMQQRQRQNQPRDNRQRVERRGGEIVHITGFKQRSSMGRTGSAEQLLEQQWGDGSIDVNRWYQGLQAAVAAHRPTTPAEVDACARVADEMYCQLLLRQNAG